MTNITLERGAPNTWSQILCYLYRAYCYN